MNITMRATYQRHWYESDEPDTEPTFEHGYTNPHNPWGGLRSEVPDELCGEAFVAWRDENVDVVEFDTMFEAAEFVADFPGGVWDYREGECECVDYRDGVYMHVTLHVDEVHKVDVFRAAEVIEWIVARNLQRRLDNIRAA